MSLKKLRPIQITAAVSSVLGKLTSLAAAASLFIENRTYGYVSILLLIFSLTACSSFNRLKKDPLYVAPTVFVIFATVTGVAVILTRNLHHSN